MPVCSVQKSVMLLFQTTANGDCLFTAVLQQVSCKPEFKAKELRRQVAFHLCRNAHIFAPMAKLRDGEKFESYIWNIFKGLAWGDNTCLAAIAKMWNVAITVITPLIDKPINIYHSKPDPDIVLVFNGGQDGTPSAGNHFSATVNAKRKNREVGYLMKEESKVPTVLNDYAEGRENAKRNWEKIFRHEVVRNGKF